MSFCPNFFHAHINISADGFDDGGLGLNSIQEQAGERMVTQSLDALFAGNPLRRLISLVRVARAMWRLGRSEREAAAEAGKAAAGEGSGGGPTLSP